MRIQTIDSIDWSNGGAAPSVTPMLAPHTVPALAITLCSLLLGLGHAWACAGSASPAAPTNPYAAGLLTTDERFSIEGEVLEELDAGAYRYYRVRTVGGSAWVVGLDATSPRGARRVRALVFARQHDFHSPRLARRFASLAFGVVRDAPLPQGVSR